MNYTYLNKTYDTNKTANQMAIDNCIVRHLSGSHAYGTSTPTSDTDYRGIFVADPHWILSPLHQIGTVDIMGEEDTTYHELGKYVALLIEQNPNIIESLWIEPEQIVSKTPEYDLLRDNREKLLSSKAMHTYSGYAHSQLNRLKGHHKWLTMIDDGKKELLALYIGGKLTAIQLRNHFEGAMLDDLKIPYVTPVDFDKVDYDWIDVIDKLWEYPSARMLCNIPITEFEYVRFTIPCDTQMIPRDGYMSVKSPTMNNLYTLYPVAGYQMYDGRGMIVTNYPRDQIDGVVKSHKDNSQLIHIYVETDNKRLHQDRWTNYHTWRKNRNVARSELEAKHSYDTKHASHLIRLLKSGLEILTTGEVLVKRPDAQELTDIRNGSLTLDELLQYADSLDNQVKAAYQTTTLQHSVSRNYAATLILQVREMFYTK